MVNLVAQGQRTPTDVDPVVAFVHRGRRGQVEDRVRNGSVRNSRGHLVSQGLEFWWRPRSVAVLAQNRRVGVRVVSGPTGVAARQDRRQRRECQTRTMVRRSAITTHADIPIIRGGSVHRYAGAGTSGNDESIPVGQSSVGGGLAGRLGSRSSRERLVQ